MTTTDWIMVVAFVVGGIVIGSIAGRITNNLLSAEGRPEPIRDAAAPLSSLAASAFIVAGLVTALGILQPSALEQMPKDIVAFIPNALTAAILVIGANVITSFVQAAIRPMMGRSSASVQKQVNLIVKAFIMGLAFVLAAAQIGINTTVVNLALAALFFGLAASLTLLVGLGGQGVAREVAASRAVRRLVSDGDHIVLGDLSGTVVAIRPTAVEIITGGGDHVLVPSTQFVGQTLTISQ